MDRIATKCGLVRLLRTSGLSRMRVRYFRTVASE